MKIIVIGASGTIGQAIMGALPPAHEVIAASRSRSAHRLDLADPASIEALFQKVGRVDAILCAAGEARFKPLAELTDEDFAFSAASKLMGQVNVVRLGLERLTDGGCITLTGGSLSRRPMPGSAAVSLVNAGLEGFTRAAALEAPRSIRINLVRPNWLAETLISMNMDPTHGTPAAEVARAYVASLVGAQTGTIFDA